MSEAPFPSPHLAGVGRRSLMRETRSAVPLFLLACLLVGALLAPAWALPVDLPGYTVADNLTAHIGEAGLAQVFAADAWFVTLAGLAGVAAGIAGWLLFHALGYWVALIATFGAFLATTTTWLVGLLIGRQDFPERLAAARPGDVVPIDLALHAHSALLVAPFAAALIVMLAAAFWPERVDPVERPHADAVDQGAVASD